MPKINHPTTPKYYKPDQNHPDYWSHIGIPGRGPELFRCIKEGITYTTFEKLVSILDTDKHTLSQAINISATTLRRRSHAGRFNPSESDRIYRTAETYRQATFLFQGSHKKTSNWFKNPNRGLGGLAPINMQASATESKVLEDMISQLELGVII